MRTTSAIRHDTLLCCGCGQESDFLQWIAEVDHQVCPDCADAMNETVWVRLKSEIEPRGGFSGVQVAFRELGETVRWRCVAPADEQLLCVLPLMKLALVAGVHPPDLINGWVVVSRTGEPIGDLRLARLFTFTREGAALAMATRSQVWRDIVPPDWKRFVARVLVVGPWDDPEEVTPVWRLEEAGRPTNVPYPWD